VPLSAATLGNTLVLAAVVIGGAMVLLWLVSLMARDASIVDIFWGPGFVLVAWAVFAWVTVHALPDGGEARRLLLGCLVTVWGLRLGIHLGIRNLGKGEDYRYVAMRRKAGGRFWIVSLGKVFLLQGALMWVVSLPLQGGQLPSTPNALGVLAFIGLAVWSVGLFFESVGDWQLARFKANPANQGKVMDRGLWRYTRHPNYFGDFLVWWGIYLVALEGHGTWWTVAGPLVMTFLLLRGSGVAVLERTIGSRRPGYTEYVRRTSAFFPLPPRPARGAPRGGNLPDG
jgi:steroid 5-alpha reductase family enzyme